MATSCGFESHRPHQNGLALSESETAKRKKRASVPTQDGHAHLGLAAYAHAAFASSVTRSQVVAFMLGRASIRVDHATRFACGAPSSAHSGVAVKKATPGATRRSASDKASSAKKGCWP